MRRSVCTALIVVSFVTSLSLLLPPPSTAQAPTVITLESLLLAVDRHPSVVAAARALDAARARLIQARAGSAVQVSLNGRAAYGTLAQGTPTGGSATFSHSVALEASVPVFDGGITALQVAQAESAVEAAQAALEAARQDVLLAAARAYFQALQTMGLVEVRAAALRFAQKQVEQAEAFFRAGTTARADVIKAQAAAASAEADLVAARGQVEIALASLRSALNLPLTQEIQVATPREPVIPEVTPTEAAALALSGRPEVRRAAAEVKSAQAALRIAEIRAGMVVSVDAGLVLQISPNPGQVGWALSATVSSPLLDGGRAKAAVEEARANLASAIARMEEIKRQVQLEAFQAAVNVREARARLAAVQASVVAAEESLRVAEGRYQAGVGTILEVLDAQTAATQARISHVQARYDLYLAVVALQHALGKPVIAQGETT
ncbi:MAG: TolC family protein [Armatimonadota bacterium]|nr:TolC family protein [Armatimonadota bacterium]MDR5703258.1 TolC family protein [Armatimonadota bacterium]